jgi:hypothetical protein
MNSKQILAAFGIASTLLLAGPVTGCASTGNSAPPAAKPATKVEEMKAEMKPETKPDVVTVTTKDYTFTVHTPAGWTGDTEGAKKYQGSVLFTQKSEAATPGGGQVLVGVYHKFDENVGLRLETEIQNYRKEYPKLELGELNIKHPRYDTFQKVLSQSGDFYQYVTYLNPGNLYSYSLFVAMSKKKTPATPAELAAYKDIVQSLQMTPPSSKPTQ